MTPEDHNPILPESYLDPSRDSGVQKVEDVAAAAIPVLIAADEIPPPIYRQFPEDLRAPWGWLDLLIFVGITFLGTFLISVVLVAVFASFGISPATLQKSANEKSLFLIINQTILSLGLLSYLATHLRAHYRAPFWRTIGWRPIETGRIPRRIVYLSLILGGFSLSLLIQLASAALQNKTKMPIETFFQDRRSALLLMLMGVLLAPLVEETIFRGYIYPVVARSFGIRAGIVITGTMFGLLHAPQLWGGWGQIALLILVGIVFTAARAVSRTVLASYLLHVSYNSFLFIAFLVASHGLRHLPVGPT
jgi:membrane protease YdiL (CAAX protease family)